MLICLRNEEWYIPQSKAIVLEERAAIEAENGEGFLDLDDDERNYQGQLLTGKFRTNNYTATVI